jgi:acyl carrier protein
VNLGAVRGTLLESLATTQVTAMLSPARLSAYAEGRQDIALRELSMDSLARMELLIALELEHQAVIGPETFARFRTLDEIAGYVVAHAAPAPEVPANGNRPETPPDCEAPAIVRLYRRALRMCRAVAQLDRVHSSLEHRMTPLELTALLACHREGGLLPAAAAEKFHRAADAWLEQQEAGLRAAGKTAPEPYFATRILPAVRLFSTPGERRDRTLLIVFTGKGRRVMVPHAAFLQHLDARRYDVLIIADARNSSFRSGGPLLGRNEYDVVAWVSRLPLLRDYPRVRTMGLSAGAYLAVLTGRHLGAELTLGVAGRFPAERHVRIILTMVFRLWRASRRMPDGQLLLCYDADRSRDKNFARIVVGVSGGRRVGVRTPGAPLGHLMLQPLLARAQLGAFLEDSLLAPLTHGRLADTAGPVIIEYPERSATSAA